MDLATVLGMFGAMSLILLSIMLGGNIGGYIDVPSIAIVIGGATLTVMTSVPFSQMLGLGKVCMKAINVEKNDLRALVANLVEFAVVARRDGILALENHIDENTHSFIATGIRMAVDGTDPDLIERLMIAEIDSLSERHRKGRQVCELLGKYAPAFGMIGTLIGLVAMLANLSDPSTIGPSMAVALLTTLYGAIIANVIFLPLADKLAYYSKEERHACMLVLQGVMAIQSGDNPRIVEQKLNVFLPPSLRSEAK